MRLGFSIQMHARSRDAGLCGGCRIRVTGRIQATGSIFEEKKRYLGRIFEEKYDIYR